MEKFSRTCGALQCTYWPIPHYLWYISQAFSYSFSRNLVYGSMNISSGSHCSEGIFSTKYLTNYDSCMLQWGWGQNIVLRVLCTSDKMKNFNFYFLVKSSLDWIGIQIQSNAIKKKTLFKTVHIGKKAPDFYFLHKLNCVLHNFVTCVMVSEFLLNKTLSHKDFEA